MVFPAGHVKGIIIQPVFIFEIKGKIIAEDGKTSPGEESFIGKLKHGLLISQGLAVIGPCLIEGRLRDAADILLGKIACPNQLLGTDQERLTGEGGKALVWGVTESGGPKWEHLPERLPRGSKKIHKVIGARSQISDPVFGGKRGGMHENAAVAFSVVRVCVNICRHNEISCEYNIMHSIIKGRPVKNKKNPGYNR